MNTQVLVHGIVQQTMVLIAHVATVGGVRAPLAKLANQVFLDLTEELTAQGLGKHVIADMFGMALRTYHRKVRAVAESQTERGRSVWEAVLEFVRENEPVSARQIHERFRHDDAQVVTGVLQDLTHSGLTYRSGRAQDAVYRSADAADFGAGQAESRREAEEYLVWLAVFRQGPITLAELSASVNLDDAGVRRAVERLLREGRVSEQREGKSVHYKSERFDVPVGADGGWEAAVLDHFQALVAAVCVKLRAGSSRSEHHDATGGGTYTFDVWPGHPHEEQARSTLARVRGEVSALRERIDQHNKEHGRASQGHTPVVFYMGQYVKAEDTVGGAWRAWRCLQAAGRATPKATPAAATGCAVARSTTAAEGARRRAAPMAIARTPRARASRRVAARRSLPATTRKACRRAAPMAWTKRSPKWAWQLQSVRAAAALAPT